MSEESLEESKSHHEELAKSASSLDWIIKLFQREALLYSELRPSYNHALVSFNSKECITNAANELFSRIMKSNSMADKMKALQAADQFLNDETAKYLANKCFDGFNSLSIAIGKLIVHEIKTVDKNSDNAKALLATQYSLTDTPATIDSSIWFLINQQKICSSPLERLGFSLCKNPTIREIVKSQIILRADADLELLFKSMNIYYYEDCYIKKIVSKWYSQLVEISSFKDTKLYDISQVDLKLVGEFLLLEDPKLTTNILDRISFPSNEGKGNYLLLLHENPVKRLTELNPTNFDGIYSCFALGLNINLFDYSYKPFYKISREKHRELASYFAELKEKFIVPYEFIKLQQILPYSRLLSLLKDKKIEFDIDYLKRFIINPKTLELVDAIGVAPIRADWGMYDLRAFNSYLPANPNWDEAAEEHFHYYISEIILGGFQVLAKSLTEYFGIIIRNDDQEFPSIMRRCVSYYVECTVDKIPRHINSYFEIIDNPTQQAINSLERLEIAIRGSMFSDEAVDIIQKKDFVLYASEKAIGGYLKKSPVFVDLARMYHKDTNRVFCEIERFLYFEQLLHNCFPNLERINLEKGFQKILAKDSFSAAIKKLIFGNFYHRDLPPILEKLEVLIKEMFKYNPEIAIWLRLEKMPTKTLLKAVYKALDASCTDMRLALAENLYSAQLLNAGLA